jgi:2-dehydro-3-deoxyphosphogluconate aldolase/(4S)-4-hydroxy-2-oxoglutarate aldolase
MSWSTAQKTPFLYSRGLSRPRRYIYFKEIKGPFQDIELLACGGVKADNIRAFFSNGASAVAFGGSIFKKEWISEGKFDRIGESIRKILEGFSSTGG